MKKYIKPEFDVVNTLVEDIMSISQKLDRGDFTNEDSVDDLFKF